MKDREVPGATSGLRPSGTHMHKQEVVFVGKKKPISSDINERLDAIKGAIASLNSEDKRLTKLGCTNASIQFKYNKSVGDTPAVSGRMVLRYPVDRGTGKRKVEYIGVDSVNQANARARLERYTQRERVRAQLQDLEFQYKELNYKVSALQSFLLSVVRDATQAVKQLC